MCAHTRYTYWLAQTNERLFAGSMLCRPGVRVRESRNRDQLVLHVERHGRVFDIHGLNNMYCWMMFLGASSDRFVLAEHKPCESSSILYVFDLDYRYFSRVVSLPASENGHGTEGLACSGSGKTIAVVTSENYRMYDCSLHVVSVDLDGGMTTTRTYTSSGYFGEDESVLIPCFIGPSSSELIVVGTYTGSVYRVGQEHCGEMCIVPRSAPNSLGNLELIADADDVFNNHLQRDKIEGVVCVGDSRTILLLVQTVGDTEDDDATRWEVVEISLDNRNHSESRRLLCKPVVSRTRGKAVSISHDVEVGLTVGLPNSENVQFPEIYGARTMRHQWMAACVRASQQATSKCAVAKVAKLTMAAVE